MRLLGQEQKEDGMDFNPISVLKVIVNAFDGRNLNRVRTINFYQPGPEPGQIGFRLTARGKPFLWSENTNLALKFEDLQLDMSQPTYQFGRRRAGSSFPRAADCAGLHSLMGTWPISADDLLIQNFVQEVMRPYSLAPFYPPLLVMIARFIQKALFPIKANGIETT